MKKQIIAFLAVAIIFALTSCGSPQNSQPEAPSSTIPSADTAVSESASASETVAYQTILPMDVKKMMDDGEDILVVDVRTPEEYSGGHLKSAINIPVETIADEKPAELPDLDALIIIYCRTGNRTRTAYEKLAELGYTNVYDMGGIVDWPYETVTEMSEVTESATPSNGTLPSGDAAETGPASPDGILSAFDSTDITGNPVDETILSGKKLTMVNVWATFCGPCIDEMPDLGALNTEYADAGFQIVGIVVDVTGNDGAIAQDMVDLAGEIADMTGAGYTHLLPSEDLSGLLNQAMYVPTTIFVDANGRQVGELYVGSRSKDDWAMIIENLLKEVG
jgi:rhodanese-related sulfurtransferase/thiol-disulfide isomerase/thioredoxin